jgi:cytochrome c
MPSQRPSRKVIDEDMMKTLYLLPALAFAFAAPAFAGDAGTEIQKGGKTGPNLYGVVGRTVASVEGFKYGDSIAAVGAKGTVWDEASLTEYVADPAAWLKKTLGDDAAKSKMTFKLTKGGEDMAAYLASVKK